MEFCAVCTVVISMGARQTAARVAIHESEEIQACIDTVFVESGQQISCLYETRTFLIVSTKARSVTFNFRSLYTQCSH